MADAPRMRRGNYLPATFAERGVAVPFTTPVLAFARMRASRDGDVQFLVPGLAGGAETYVIPMSNFSEALELSVFDRAFLEELEALETPKPLTIRALYLKTAVSGLAGPRHARAAREALKRDAENREALRAHLADAAAKAEVSDEPLEARLEQWSGIVLPIGSPRAGVEGPLLRTMQDLETLAEQLRRWLVPEPVVPAEQAQRIGVVAERAAADVRKVADFVDSLADDIARPLADWEATEQVLTDSVERMSCILDGWRRISDRWEEARRGDRIDQREAVEMFAMYMPVMPAEAAGEDRAFWEEIREAQRRWQHSASFQAWMDVDETLRDRLQKFVQDDL